MENLTLEKSRLFNKIESLIATEVNNNELVRNMNKLFYEKNLNTNTIYCLLNNSKDVKDLDLMEQIAVAKACYDYKQSSGLDYKKYFSTNEIVQFDSYISTQEKINIIEFNDFLKINDFLYRGNGSYLKICQYFENMLFIYNIDTQRANAIKKFGNMTVRKPSVDKKTVRAIKDSIINGTFEDTEIILNVRMIEGKVPYFDFKPKYKDILGDIEIKPQYTDSEDDRYTIVDILDGYHRILAIKEAVDEYYQENGEYLEGSIGIKIVFADAERALRIVDQTFKRSNTDKQFLEAIKTNDYTLLVDAIIKNSKELKNNVARTYDECLAFNKLTHRAILNRMTEYLKISSDNLISRNFESKKYAKLIDDYIQMVKHTFKEDEINKYINPNIFAGIIAFGKACSDKGIKVEINELEELITMIMNLSDEDIRRMKLMYKNCSIYKIVEIFGGVIK